MSPELTRYSVQGLGYWLNLAFLDLVIIFLLLNYGASGGCRLHQASRSWKDELGRFEVLESWMRGKMGTDKHGMIAH